MKVDRRSFLGLGLGAAAGIAVSPVAIKLTDDSSIWTQNWPWTPVPEDGEITYDHTACSLCPGSCGLSVRRIKGRPVKIEGIDGYPVNNGGACLHGIAGLQYLYDPSRVKTPMKKENGRFKAISWDAAISLVAEKLKDLRRKKMSSSLACITGSDKGSVNALFKRFMDAYGSANALSMPSLEGNLALTAATLHGADHTIGFDLENSDFILSFGAGIIDGWGSPVACFQANASRKERHAKLFQIEPRLSNTAALADKWIPIKPGTEADLALGICAVLLNKNIFTPGEFGTGFSRFTAMVQKAYAPAKVEATTGIPAAQIDALAQAFVKADMPVAVPGRGRGDYGQSLREFAAVQTLNALAGRLNQKGGAFVMAAADYLSFPEAVMDMTAEAGAGKDKLAATVPQFFDTLAASSAPAVNALFVYNANPCYTLHNTAEIKKAIAKVPFKVSFSSFMDETAMECDVILPASTFLERLEDVPSGAGLSRTVVGLSRPMVKKTVFNTKNPGDAIIMLAKAMGGTVAESFDWDSYDQCLESVAGDIWDTLSDEGVIVLSKGAPNETVATDFSFLSANPAGAGTTGQGDFTLVAIDNLRLAGTVPAASPFAIKTVSDKVLLNKDILVDINPDSAKAKGLANGGDAKLTTALGTFKVKVNFDQGIMPGVIAMARGLGHTLANNPFAGGKGVNVNDTIGPMIEEGSGLDAAFGTKASISRA